MGRLNVLSIGAGAIGTYIGGSLALKGHNLSFVERPEVATELQARGLHIVLGEEKHHIPNPKVFHSIGEALNAETIHVAIFALKSYDTPHFLNSIKDIPSHFPPVLCLSNGVENEPALAKVFGPNNVIAGTVTTAIGRQAAGDILLERLRGVGIGLGHPLSQRLVTAFQGAGLQARPFASSSAMKWSKMLTNLMANATSAILDMPPADIFAHPGLYRLEMKQLRETLAVMHAQGIRVVDLPGTPVRLLAFVIRTLPLSISRLLLARAVGSGRGAKMPSFHIDLHSGRGKSEVDYLNGAVVRAGENPGIHTPANALLNRTLLHLTDGSIPLEAYRHKPDRLLSEFKTLERKKRLT